MNDTNEYKEVLRSRYYYNGEPTKYDIYSDGRVYNTKSEKFVKSWKNNSGYLNVVLWLNNTKKIIRGVHQLVAQVFIPNPDNLPTVNHKDGNKENNDMSNLEWMSQSDQNKHAYASGLRKPNHEDQVPFTKYIHDQVVEACELMSKGIPPLVVETQVGIPVKMLYDMRKKNHWKHITTKYEFPELPPCQGGYDPMLKLKGIELLKKGLMPREIMNILGETDPNLYKALRDWKYHANKVQRLASNGVDA